jgi:hypothetical protein
MKAVVMKALRHFTVREIRLHPLPLSDGRCWRRWTRWWNWPHRVCLILLPSPALWSSQSVWRVQCYYQALPFGPHNPPGEFNITTKPCHLVPAIRLESLMLLRSPVMWYSQSAWRVQCYYQALPFGPHNLSALEIPSWWSHFTRLNCMMILKSP